MSDIEADDVDQLMTTITNLELPERQRRLMDAILKVAKDVVDPDDRAFSEEFREAFSKKQADLVLEYVESEGASSGTSTEPARIVRLPPPPPEGIIRRAPTDDDRP